MSNAARLKAKVSNLADELVYLQQLIRFPSVTPNEAGAIAWLDQQLTQRGFSCELFECQGVSNLIAKYEFGPGSAFAFCGHIDVVPAAAERWRCDPFAGDIIDGEMYGRGAADMKGGVAAMLAATDRLLAAKPTQGQFYWLITSDEEGEAEFGSAEIAKHLANQGVRLDACLVGEPTADLHAGDTIKNGRRGALSARISVKGRAGHVAYPEHTVNAAHIGAQLAVALQQIHWHKDIEGSKTTLQVTGLHVPNSLDNLVPAQCQLTFNVRYSHGYRSNDVQDMVNQALAPWLNEIEISWERPCEPYYTSGGGNIDLIAVLESAIYACTHSYPKLSTSGGTSDGRFFANEHTQVVECGVRNHTIHQDNERVAVADLNAITDIYAQTLKQVFACS
ncbi:succinyl-diaminopimelate desuccinylase [Pseudoalteromonas sp. T1lg10]|uniref:succinyl-diaminopimelate desuccinylase n=1 Tax=Pseudoalteromonas sp. T1lg10 TaxID=2077093 RepID=UPI000CF748B6|nr:succinyl-diaminopimelate desuccinylase [Pseudoalteromonas sp. T1lg10]